MRDYKFRGQKIDTKEWVYGCLMTPMKGEWISKQAAIANQYVGVGNPCYECENPFEEICLVIPETVGQYIWLEDKNKKEAYTGDIFKQEGRKLRWIIYLSDGGARCCTTNEWNDTNGDPVLCEGLSDLQNSRCFTQNAEIVGNIYENPELMKGGAE